MFTASQKNKYKDSKCFSKEAGNYVIKFLTQPEKVLQNNIRNLHGPLSIRPCISHLEDNKQM